VREVGRVLAALLAAAVFAYSFALAGPSTALVSLCLLTVPAVLAGLTLFGEGLLTLAALGLVAQYAGALYFADVEGDLLAPLVAAAVLLFVEAGDLGLSVPPGTALDRSVVRGRLLAAATSVTLAVAVSAATLALAALGLAGSTAVRAAGLVGAAVAVAASLALFRAPAGDRNVDPG